MYVSRTFWLTLTNIALGIAALLCVVGTAVAVACGIREQRAKRKTYMSDIEREYPEVFGRSEMKGGVASQVYIDARFETGFSRVCSCFRRRFSALKRALIKPRR